MFAGVTRNISKQRAQIAVYQAQLQKEQVEKQLNRDLLNAYDRYKTLFDVYELQVQNRQVASENFKRTNEAYKRGVATTTQLRESQINQLRADIAAVQTQFQLKQSELELRRIAGSLLNKLEVE